MKNTIFIALLLSSSAIANQHQPFQNNFFSGGFNKNVWSNFNNQFQQFNNKMRLMQNNNIFDAQSDRYFDNETNSYIIKAKVPNLTKENLDISTKNNTIYINGSSQKIEKTANSSKSSSNQFSQSYSLPKDADQDNFSVKFKDDLLIISIPKLIEEKPLSN